MKTELKAKFLQHLLKKKPQDQGFTLIELLVVIIIIGILSAIALPSFLNQTAKARQSEARTNVGAMNRAQQAYYLENQAFAATNVSDLGLGLSNSDNYTYSVGSLTSGVANKAKSANADLKGYAGGVFNVSGNTQAILCETTGAGNGTIPDPSNHSACGTDLKRMN
ncbi:type IV pilin-like G/H family protein [Gloeocapsopsis sp. IPPAS B-1203]|uniref:type IV pilin-like G/H family protein n=1 Tax=Gloeocapsopsis sp. IPPAS B-1203 TaxID=2049454 RepID=UPI000C1878F2|nr:type IV pilin-like G/H family protein [Gloeocapsopsis sp. IPPAS B-1203]PIG95470.1 general secretion pathway protein GspH [Gloeocapsopsis sp. IPPAS B-1203]